MSFFHPILKNNEYIQTDLAFQEGCFEAELRDVYFNRRIINDCEDYTPPALGMYSNLFFLYAPRTCMQDL